MTAPISLPHNPFALLFRALWPITQESGRLSLIRFTCKGRVVEAFATNHASLALITAELADPIEREFFVSRYAAKALAEASGSLLLHGDSIERVDTETSRRAPLGDPKDIAEFPSPDKVLKVIPERVESPPSDGARSLGLTPEILQCLMGTAREVAAGLRWQAPTHALSAHRFDGTDLREGFTSAVFVTMPRRI
ncbi:MAG TPA: hypothetical protein VK509_09470 [Polyangiales bacterium]|nr:hypothetical protein [Polyangiales bacterium]